MKNKVFAMIFFISISLFSQVSSLNNLASGELELFSAIIELDGSIYGYFSIYKLENVSETQEKYSYVFLDKNLNKVANGEFIDSKYRKYESEFYSPEKIGDNLIISKLNYYGGNTYKNLIGSDAFVSHRMFDIKNNKMLDSFYYEGKTIIEGERAIEKIRKEASKQEAVDYPLVFSNGFFMFERMKNPKKVADLRKIKTLKAYAADKTLLWEYLYNPDNKRIKYGFKVMNEDSVIFWTKEEKEKTLKIHSLNPKTGEVFFVYEIENRESDYSHRFIVKIIKDKVIILGNYSPYKAYDGYVEEDSLGYFKIELDTEGNELARKYLNWEEISSSLDLDRKLKKRFKLSSTQYFVFGNETISILTEKWRGNNYIINFDKEFNFKEFIKLEKKENKSILYSKYLFSQPIENGNGVVFFYRDFYYRRIADIYSNVPAIGADGKKTKPKLAVTPGVLVIVTIIDGKINKEEIPITTERLLYPYVAKEGYVLLREYNKDSKEDEIRLERLNY